MTERKKVAKLEKAMEALRLENSALEAKKVSMEDEFLTQQGNIVLLLGETFNQAIRQSHPLYGVPPVDSSFDVNKDVHEGQMVTFAELSDLPTSTSRATNEDVEYEDQ